MFNYTKKDIINSLSKIAIMPNDDIFIHNNLGFFGMLEGCETADDLCANMLETLKEIVGEEGTVILPTFSYSYCHGQVYIPEQTETTCGMLSTYMIKHYAHNRSLDPNFSICGIGKHINEYKNCNIHESFGKGSFWEIFLKYNGKIVCMNFDSGSTFLHYIERVNNVEYRYNKSFNGESIINNKKIKDYAVHYVYDLEKEEDAPFFERIDILCKQDKISKTCHLGKGSVLAYSSAEYFDYISNLLNKRPRILCRVEE